MIQHNCRNTTATAMVVTMQLS